ncbi:hypothetical protein CRU87_04325 [Aliarcobacter trophiarum LMG 25534]|uniref:Lipoprotein n=1 Tax=Aliarcobacter trophiarum LMG 25534 TaxID=1032241 RepID=A0AAD0QJ92_9BACT|nr:hypothetical protein [Aliarcobacter trophiarum]AXK48749.1 hypothetical protein ATR_0882 [Aliarcobacter trophiarum LMG 25534]RXI25076.1 hypothetical protein CRU89_09715 [Aliarcobacter trophiarum]RXJ92072.1 hypothetical protein CRU87_04325 [Aliarcobacter trophiarum LMG 25534]
MKKSLFLVAISLMFVSCTPKNSAFRYFDKGDIETTAIRNTKKADIVKDNEIDAIFMATYLNKFDPKISDKEENFLVYIFFPNKEEQEFKTSGYELSLNGKIPFSMEKIEKDNKKFQDMMLRNFWGTYYLVKFTNKELVDKLQITLRPKSSDATLNFEK